MTIAEILTTRRRMEDVWFLLDRKYPDLRMRGDSVFHARRDGRIRLLIQNRPQYAPINKPFGPETDDDWDLLHTCVLEAIGTTTHALRMEFLP